MNQEKKGTVLVVDDDLASLGALFEHLDQAGFKVLVAQDGASALKRVERSQPDIILLDVNLPDIDGFEACRRLKESDRSAEIPVIFLTVLDDVRYVLKGLDLAAVDYITKPFAPEEVIARVDKHLAFHNLQKQLEAQNAQLQQGIAERKRVEEALRERTHELGERVKELNCLYGISQLVEKRGITLHEILQGTVDLIPPAWQYPEIASARIILEGQEFKTDNFEETAWRQVHDIKVRGNAAGRTEVCYLEERPEIDEGPFLEEERKLLNAITERLGRIVERVRAEEALRESEEKFRLIAETSIDTIYQLDAKGNIVFMNTAGARMYGYEPQEMEVMNFGYLLTKERLAEGEEVVRRVLSGESVQGEMYVKHKDGHDFPIYFSMVPVEKEGKIVGFSGISRDITERVRAEEALRYHAHVLENVSDAIISSDVDSNIQSWNQAAEEIYGWRADEVIGKPASDVVQPEWPDRQREEVIEQLFADGRWEGEAVHRRKDGTPIQVLVSITLLKDDEGNPQGVVSANSGHHRAGADGKCLAGIRGTVS